MPRTGSPHPKKLLSKAQLQRALESSKKRGVKFRTAGIDGLDGATFARSENRFLVEIARRLADGTYRFSRLRPIWIPKKHSNKERLICVPTIADRLVQRAILLALTEPDRLGVLNEVSFGFRIGSGVGHALNAALSHRHEHRWVLKTDVSSFFDSIPREPLIEKLRTRLPPSLFPLLKQVICSEVQCQDFADSHKIHSMGIRDGVGLRQGMPLSPWLSNFVMKPFDMAMIQRKARIVRYADDIIMFFDSRQQAIDAESEVRSELAKLELSIPELGEQGKTKIVAPEEEVEFLGIDLAFSEKLGKYIQKISESSIEKIVKDIITGAQLSTCLRNDMTLNDFISRINSRVQSYRSTYSEASNCDLAIRRIQFAAGESIRSLLGEVFGRENVSRLSSPKLKFLGFDQSGMTEASSG